MAGGESLGSLYFDLGLNDEDFVKKLDAIKKNDFKIKIGIDSSELANIKSLLSSISSSGIKSGTKKKLYGNERRIHPGMEYHRKDKCQPLPYRKGGHR